MGVAATIVPGTIGDGGTVFGQGVGSEDPKKPLPPASIALTPEHYNRIARLLAHKIPVKLRFNIQNEFLSDNLDSMNVTAEIPGNSKKDEIVMLGAHLDSWHGGTGATDNAAGSAVVIETMRVLKALNLKMDRTVRMALWSGFVVRGARFATSTRTTPRPRNSSTRKNCLRFTILSLAAGRFPWKPSDSA